MSAHNLLGGLHNVATIISLFLSVSALSVAGRYSRAAPGLPCFVALLYINISKCLFYI